MIICPKCGRARGVESVRKTVTCQCGRQIKLGRLKLQYLTDSPIELAKIIGEVNASLKGSGPMPKDKKRKSVRPLLSPEKVKGIRDPLERMRMTVAELAKKKREFGADDLAKIAAQLGGGSPEKVVQRLLESGVIYEVAPGKFRPA